MSQTEGRICCLCCERGPTTATMSLAKWGYLAGEVVTGTITLETLSNRAIRKCTCSLVQYTICTSRRGHKKVRGFFVFILLRCHLDGIA